MKYETNSIWPTQDSDKEYHYTQQAVRDYNCYILEAEESDYFLNTIAQTTFHLEDFGSEAAND